MKGANTHTLHKSQKNLNFKKKSEVSGVKGQESGRLYVSTRVFCLTPDS